MSYLSAAKNKISKTKLGNLAENLALLLDARDIKQRELADQTGVLTSTINKILKGTVDNPQLFTLISLCEFFEITLDQLVGLEPLPEWVYKNSGLKTSALVSKPEVKFIPILSFNEINRWISSGKYSKETQQISVDNSYSDDSFAVRLTSTLNGRFQKRSLLIFSTDDVLASEYYVLVSENGGSPQVRTIVRDGDRIYLKPIEDFIPSVALHDGIKVIARLVEIRYWSR